MLTPQHTQELSTTLACIRDLAVVALVGFIAFQIRAVSPLFTSVQQFMGEVRAFMLNVTGNLNLVVNNHLKHLQDSGERIETSLQKQNELLTAISNQQEKAGK
jgi:hypothetical protein